MSVKDRTGIGKVGLMELRSNYVSIGDFWERIAVGHNGQCLYVSHNLYSEQ